MDTLHPIQFKILKELLFKPDARFSDLNEQKISSDHFNFHLKSLLKQELIIKTGSKYTLTHKGKEFANRMDTDKLEIERQPKLSIKPIVYKEENGQIYFLAQQRLKQPYFGLWGFPGGKIRWGETLNQSALRELEEETGISGDCSFKGIQHKLDIDEFNQLLEDKFFFVIAITNPKGILIEHPEGGLNKWLTKEEMQLLPRFDGVDELMELITKPHIQLIERNYHYKNKQY